MSDDLQAGSAAAETDEKEEHDPETLEDWLRSPRAHTAGHPLRALYRKLDMTEERRVMAPHEHAASFAQVSSLLSQW